MVKGNQTIPVRVHLLRNAILTASVPVLELLRLNAASAQDLEEVVITEQQGRRYTTEQLSLGKFTESLRDTPQSVATISAAMLDDRGAMNLDDALRNIPGITLGAGEFSWQGNNPSIRGFPSRNDMFIDGMRDIGSYSRDPFNLESIEVLQGTSSMIFGRGSTGGVINQNSKRPGRDSIRSLHINAGNADTLRVTADYNRALGSSAAVRVNALYHESSAPGRENAEGKRTGIAPSLSLGLGSATQLTLSYMKLDSEAVPDYGLPWVEGAPARVDRENYYGFDDDYLDTDADIANLNLVHQLNPAVSINAQFKYADYSRASRITEPQVEPSVTQGDVPEMVTVYRMMFSGESEEKMIQGQLNLRADFRTGGISHAMTAGIEMSTENSNPGYSFAGVTPYFDYDLPTPTTNLANPSGTFSGITARRLQADTKSETLAAYALDTLKFGERWQWVIGLRWDRFDTDNREQRFEVNGTETSSTRNTTTDIEVSYRSALVYKPSTQGTLYLGWGTSFNPSAEAVSFISSGRSLTTSNALLTPEENESLELGVKWGLLDDRLAVDAALFRMEKNNARVADPLNPGFNILAGRQEVQGFSVNMAGRLSERLQVSAGYSWLDDMQINTLTGAVTDMQNVAEHSMSLWLDWSYSEKLSLGGGVRYLDERTSGGGKWVDGYWVLDAMARYSATDQVSFKLNLTNITDEYYIDQIHPWHVVPGPALGAVFAVNLDY